MLLIIASNSDKLFIGVNVDDFEPLPPPKKIDVLVNAISGCDTHFKEWIAPKWLEMDLDNMHMTFF